MFEKVIVRAGSPRGLSFPIALALHGLAIGAVVGSSVWFPGEPSEPPVPVTFPHIPRATAGTSSPEPGRPKPAGTSRRPGAAAPLRLPTSGGAAARSVLPDRFPATDDTITDRTGDGSFVDGANPGDGRGDQPGEEGATEDSGGDDIVRPGGAVRAPELLRRVDPQYPEAARKARIEGVVILDAVIAASGEVEEVRVLRSAGKLLDDAAARALRQWTYRPATLNGRAVRVLLTVTVDFRVH